MGGFVGNKPPDELYIRGAQFGLLSAVVTFPRHHPREPWNYGSGALEVVKYYANLRYTLIPYLLRRPGERRFSGMPILRPMALGFPQRTDDRHGG